MLIAMLKKLINAKTYSKVEMEKRVNTFFAFDQIDEASYTELMNLISNVYA